MKVIVTIAETELNNKILSREIKETFEDREVFTREELLSIYKKYEPDLKETTVGWRIFNLKKKKIIRDVGKGLYELVRDKKFFKPHLEHGHKILFTKITNRFDQVSFCLWSSSWLNDLSIHQSGKSFLILETDPDIRESVFFFTKEELNKNIYLEPSGDLFDKYIITSKDPILLTKIITKAPLQQVDGVTVPRLEKILVDVFVSEEYFPAFHGQELTNIFNMAYHRYEINFSTLFHYSRRRGAENQLKEFLKQFTDIPQKIITG